eukprot:Pgem_evm1s12075
MYIPGRNKHSMIKERCHIVHYITPSEAQCPLVRISCRMHEGFSGGPLFNDEGVVFAISSSGSDDISCDDCGNSGLCAKCFSLGATLCAHNMDWIMKTVKEAVSF